MRWTGSALEIKNATPIGVQPNVAYLGSTHVRTTTGAATAQVYMNSNGRAFRRVNGATATDSGINWFSPTTTGIGSSYWVKYFLQGQVFASGGGTGYALTTMPTGWISCSSDAGITLSRTFAAQGSAECTVGYQISSDSGGSTIVSSGTFALYLEYTV
jgi:hypothetical protein